MTSTSAAQLLLASSLSIAALCSASAQAEEPVLEKPCSAIPACAEQLQKAKQLTKDQHDDEALKAFLVLYSQFPDPRLCVGIGRMMHRRGQYEKAAIFYQRLLDSGVEKDPQNLAKVRRFLAEAYTGMQAEAQAPPQVRPLTTSSGSIDSGVLETSKPTAFATPLGSAPTAAVAPAPAVPLRVLGLRPMQSSVPDAAPTAAVAPTPAVPLRVLGLRPMQSSVPDAAPTAAVAQTPAALPPLPPASRSMPIASVATGPQADTAPDHGLIAAGRPIASTNLSVHNDLKPEDASSPELSARPQDRSPIYKRWWFWTAIGTVTAGVVVGTALGAYAREPNWPGAETIHPFP